MISGTQWLTPNRARRTVFFFYLYSKGNITVTVTNPPAGDYDFYVYAHGGADNQNSIVELAVGSEIFPTQATTNGPGSPLWEEGVQYVKFRNVYVSSGQPITITAEPASSQYAVINGLQMANVSGLAIFGEPTNQTVIQGATAPFGVTAVGTPPLAYQWLFNNAAISAATNDSFTATNAQIANAGSYWVIVTNAYGSVTSAVATLTVLTPFITAAARNADGTVTLAFVSPPSATARLWSATSLTPPISWQPIFTNTGVGPNGAWQFTDTNAVNYPEAFYRISVP